MKDNLEVSSNDEDDLEDEVTRMHSMHPYFMFTLKPLQSF